MHQKPFIRHQGLTDLEKSLGVRQPGLYRPDGSFVPTRKAREIDYLDMLRDALKDQGVDVKITLGEGWEIIPPYPEGASRQEKRQLDREWQKRIYRMFEELKKDAHRPPSA